MLLENKPGRATLTLPPSVLVRAELPLAPPPICPGPSLWKNGSSNNYFPRTQRRRHFTRWYPGEFFSSRIPTIPSHESSHGKIDDRWKFCKLMIVLLLFSGDICRSRREDFSFAAHTCMVPDLSQIVSVSLQCWWVEEFIVYSAGLARRTDALDERLCVVSFNLT